MIDRINGRVAILLSAAFVLLVLLVGWFAFVAPQRSKAASLDTQAAEKNDQIVSTEAFLKGPTAKDNKRELRLLDKAFPADVHMSEVVRQLAAAAAKSRIAITGITPTALVPTAGGQAVPITLAVQGHYFGISEFVHLLRKAASAAGKSIHTSGRLYSIDSIDFSNTAGGNVITATLAINAFTSTPAAPPPTPPTTTTTSS